MYVEQLIRYQYITWCTIPHPPKGRSRFSKTDDLGSQDLTGLAFGNLSGLPLLCFQKGTDAGIDLVGTFVPKVTASL